jgi:hypothetical protein
MFNGENVMKAFPYSIDNGESVKGEKGMDLRDYFAAQAVAALIQGGIHPNVWELSRDAYKIADAMMEIRNDKV